MNKHNGNEQQEPTGQHQQLPGNTERYSIQNQNTIEEGEEGETIGIIKN